MPQGIDSHNRYIPSRLLMEQKDDMLVEIRSKGTTLHKLMSNTITQSSMCRKAKTEGLIQYTSFDLPKILERGWVIMSKPCIIRRFFALGCRAIGESDTYEIFVRARALRVRPGTSPGFKQHTFPQLINIILSIWDRTRGI